MNRKLFIFLFFLLPISLFATQDNLVSNIQGQIHNIAQSYYGVFSSNALGLLYALGVIQLVLTFGFMAMRGELEVAGAFAQLVKTALIIGFFSMLISSPSWFNNIYNSITNLAFQAGGNKANVENVFENMIVMWDKLGEDTYNPIKYLGLMLVGIVVSVAITLLVAQALMYYAFSVLSVYVGILWLGFGSFDQTRPWAINAIANVLRNGFKWMMTLLVLAITFDFVQTLSDTVTNDFSLINMVVLAMTAILITTINAGVGGFVDSYFTGSGSGENSRGMQMAAAVMSAGAGAAMGAYQGAKGASNTIAAAAATGEEKSTLGKAASYLGGMASGATKGAMHGGENFATNWAKTIDPNYSSASSLYSGKNFASAANEKNASQSDPSLANFKNIKTNVSGKIN
ncbi:MAG: type IV secretion system protein [Sulfurovaceae bacterium]